MAGAMSKITKNTLANLSKAFPQAPSLYARSNVPKLGFVSVSNYSKLQGGSVYTIDADDELGALTQKSKENINMEDLMETTKDKGHEMKEKTKDEARDMKETAKDAAGSMTDKAKEAAGTAKDKAAETAEDVKRKAGMGVTDDEKSGQTMGEKARQTMEEMWVVAKDTKDKIKESVVGKSNKDDHHVVEDHVPERKVYQDVVDSARKVGNMDHEKHK